MAGMRTEHLRRAAVAALIIAPFATARADDVSMPNTIDTPGAADPAASWGVICNGTTRERRHVTAAMKAEVLAAYNIPRTQASYYEIDHLVPLAIGGANVVANLWPQPWAEADQKDVLEVELQRRVCHGQLSQAEAQRAIADDWTAAYARYVGGRLIAAPDPPTLAADAPPAPRPTMKAQIRAEVLRLARRWIFRLE
jgi:hypothetical protein